MLYLAHLEQHKKTVRANRKGMSRNRYMHEQMAPISVREATHYSAY